MLTVLETSNETQTPVNTHVSMVNDSLDMGMNIFQDNEETAITIPTNTSDAIPFNTMATQHEEIHTPTEVQTYEPKNTINRKVIDETTLRIYFPRHVDTVDIISTIQTNAATPTSLDHPHPNTALSQTKAADSLGSIRFLSAHSPSLYTMIS